MPAIGEEDTHGCCEPPVARFTASPTSLKVWNISSPARLIVVASALVYGLSPSAPSCATLPGCVAYEIRVPSGARICASPPPDARSPRPPNGLLRQASRLTRLRR